MSFGRMNLSVGQFWICMGKHRDVTKELIGKIHNTESSLSKKFVIEKREITEIRNIAEESLFYKFLTKSSQKCFKFFKLIH